MARELDLIHIECRQSLIDLGRKGKNAPTTIGPEPARILKDTAEDCPFARHPVRIWHSGTTGIARLEGRSGQPNPLCQMLARLPVAWRQTCTTRWRCCTPRAQVSRKNPGWRRTTRCGQRRLTAQSQHHWRCCQCALDKPAAQIFARSCYSYIQAPYSSRIGFVMRNFGRCRVCRFLIKVVRFRFFCVHINYRCWPMGHITISPDHQYPRARITDQPPVSVKCATSRLCPPANTESFCDL